MSRRRKENKEREMCYRFEEIIKAIEEMESAKTADFKEMCSLILSFLVKSITDLSMKITAMEEVIIKRAKDTNKIHDIQLKHRDSVETMRFYLLLETGRSVFVWDRLNQLGLIDEEKEMPAILNKVWKDERLSVLGYDCTVDELKSDILESKTSAEKQDARG